MPVIKPRTGRRTQVRHITRLWSENEEALFAYAHFIHETPAYLLNELIEKKLITDPQFKVWRAEHPESYVPARRAKNGEGESGRVPTRHERAAATVLPASV